MEVKANIFTVLSALKGRGLYKACTLGHGLGISKSSAYHRHTEKQFCKVVTSIPIFSSSV